MDGPSDGPSRASRPSGVASPARRRSKPSRWKPPGPHRHPSRDGMYVRTRRLWRPIGLERLAGQRCHLRGRRRRHGLARPGGGGVHVSEARHPLFMPVMFVGGVVFGLDLGVSHMSRPEVVLDSLQLRALGLLFVMGPGSLVMGGADPDRGRRNGPRGVRPGLLAGATSDPVRGGRSDRQGVMWRPPLDGPGTANDPGSFIPCRGRRVAVRGGVACGSDATNSPRSRRRGR